MKNYVTYSTKIGSGYRTDVLQCLLNGKLRNILCIPYLCEKGTPQNTPSHPNFTNVVAPVHSVITEAHN